MPILPALDPELIRAVVTTKWGASGYRPGIIRTVESYMIESNMDQDSDPFELTFGDPGKTLTALLRRDSEIHVQIFGIGVDVPYLMTGIADDVDFNEQNSFVLSGRDRSSIAADTIAEPGLWRAQRVDEFIRKRATELKVATKFNLASGYTKKVIKTDGSETEWEFWYRLIRHEGDWLWFSSDGTLNSGKLKTGAPTYFFGTPPLTVSAGADHHWLPVERIGYRKTTQPRVGDVEIFYHSGGRHESFRAEDLTTRDWVKRPLKFLESSHIHSKPQAKKAVYEEIFETKVGALEIKILVPDIGIIIQQNNIARLNIPEVDVGGDWFIVGTRIIADEGGFMQEVRLREKGYAVSARVPEEPETEKEPSGDPEDTGGCLSAQGLNIRWLQFFINAAHQHRSNVDFALYLATIIAMADQESGFRNVRQGGSVEWFKWEGKPQSGITSKAEWEATFKNDNGEGGGGVGPMQLTTQSYKIAADQFGGGVVDELIGNRWSPEANIMEGANVLKGKGATSEATLWDAVRAYNGSGSAAEAYKESVRRKVYNSPGYLKMIQDAITDCADEGDFGGGGNQDICAAECRTLGSSCWGGSKEIADRLWNIAKEASPDLSASGKRCTRDTADGNVSDHYYGRLASWAYDISNGTQVPDPSKDKAAKAMLNAFGLNYTGGVLDALNINCGDFRVQFIYRTPKYGGHMNHIHVGVRNEKLDKIIDSPPEC